MLSKKTHSTQKSESRNQTSNPSVQFKDNRNPSVSNVQKMANNSIQMKPNNTGLPNQLKSGIENLSGYSMDDVKVHYNSPKPAQLNAHAYAQGTDIHVASGQEKHLPHEAWHVVQQKQGRVQPTKQLKGKVNINDDTGLEREADVMGAKALQMKKETTGIKQTTGVSGSIVQRAYATVDPQTGPIELTWSDTYRAFRSMTNNAQREGQEVKNTLGFTEALNAASWSGFGKSPRNYHRAHGYAKSFGGGGDISNVAWWPSSDESSWTLDEDKVRGGGQGPIAAWKPGDGETGNFEVKRELYPATDFKPNFLKGINSAINWAFNDSREAWRRAIAASEKTTSIRSSDPRSGGRVEMKRYKLSEINAAKETAKSGTDAKYNNWLDSIFGAATGLFIKKMGMDYTITETGDDPGSSRGNLSKSYTAIKPNASSFGLKDNVPERLWKQILTGTLFTKGGASVPNIKAESVDSQVPYDVPVELSSHEDGWGAE